MSALLEASDLTIRFGGLTAIDGVHLRLAKGDLRGLIGPNGAGKSTLFNAFTGLVAPSGGRIMLDGTDISAAKPHERAARGIRRTFQTLQLMTSYSVLENVLVGAHLHIPRDAIGHVLGGRRSPDRQAVEEVLEVLRLLDLDSVMLREVGTLSFAQQRFVEIARALAGKPKLLLLDEPAAGLSPAEVEQVGNLLLTLRNKWDLTILLVEHVISLVMSTCDRVTVLDQGRVIAEGEASLIASDPRVRAAYLGEEGRRA